MTENSHTFEISVRLMFIVLAIPLFFFLGGVVFFSPQIIQRFNLKSQNIQQAGSSEDIEVLLREVEEKYLLPDEVPTIATVNDRENLPDDNFFHKAQNGDRILLYRNSQLGVIYRPTIKKVVHAGHYSPEGIGESARITPTPEEFQEVGVLILNGTNTVGITQDATEQLEELEFVTVDDRLDANDKPYEKTMIVTSDKEFEHEAERISEVIGGEIVSELPEGESSESRIVIILGYDFVKSLE